MADDPRPVMWYRLRAPTDVVEISRDPPNTGAQLAAICIEAGVVAGESFADLIRFDIAVEGSLTIGAEAITAHADEPGRWTITPTGAGTFRVEPTADADPVASPPQMCSFALREIAVVGTVGRSTITITEHRSGGPSPTELELVVRRIDPQLRVDRFVAVDASSPTHPPIRPAVPPVVVVDPNVGPPVGVTLSWITSGADEVRLFGPDGEVTSGVPQPPTGPSGHEILVHPITTSTYTLIASRRDAGHVIRQLTVTVQPTTVMPSIRARHTSNVPDAVTVAGDLRMAAGNVLTTRRLALDGAVEADLRFVDGTTLHTGELEVDSEIDSLAMAEGTVLSATMLQLPTGFSGDIDVEQQLTVPKVSSVHGRPLDLGETLTVVPDLWPYESDDVAWSPDGTQIATAGVHGTVRIWDATNGDQLRQLDGHEGGVHAVAWTGARGLDAVYALATAGEDGIVRVWDPNRSNEPLVELEGHVGSVRDVAWSPYGSGFDPSRLATAGEDGTVRIWDPRADVWNDRNDRPLSILRHPRGVLAVAWSPDGQRLATTCEDGIARVWGARTGAQTHERREAGTPGPTARSIDWLSDVYFTTSGDDGRVRLWNLVTEDPQVLGTGAGAVNSVAWNPHGVLAVASENGGVTLWNQGGDLLRPVGPPDGTVTALAWNRDTRRLAAATRGGAAQVWDVWLPPDHEPSLVLDAEQTGVARLQVGDWAFVARGRELFMVDGYTATEPRRVWLFTVPTGGARVIREHFFGLLNWVRPS